MTEKRNILTEEKILFPSSPQQNIPGCFLTPICHKEKKVTRVGYTAAFSFCSIEGDIEITWELFVLNLVLHVFLNACFRN